MKIENISNNKTTYYTHGFHPYPAKFIPQIVNKYYNLYCREGFTILDPFCGSGTTLVEAILNGMNSIGIDLNPIAVLISRAKTNNYSEAQLKEILNFKNDLELNLSGIFSNGWLNEKRKNVKIHFIQNQKHWFQENVSIELSILKEMINNIKDEIVKDLLFCAFSKIILKVSNQDSEVRYTAKNKNLPDGIVFSEYIKTISTYLEVLLKSDFIIKGKAEIYNDDTYKTLINFKENNFDFIITSPPYINTFDYYLYHKLRMLWLDFDYKPIRKNEIGNHHRIDSQSLEVAKTEYINSMRLILNEISRISKPNSYFIMIIGDGIVDGVTIDMSKIISEINCNYSIENIESINLSDITKSFNKKFSNAPKKEHTITLKNIK